MNEKPDVSRHNERFRALLAAAAILAGGFAGIAAVCYRVALDCAEKSLNFILKTIGEKPLLILLWLLVLLFLAWTVGRLVSFEPGITGGGILQTKDEIEGKTDLNWKKIIPIRFAGGCLCVLGGLALGRAGPSVHLGAMAAKGVSKGLKCDKKNGTLMITCGSSAGLSATFHSPVSGIVFSFEKIYKKFSFSLLICVVLSSLTAFILSGSLLGFNPVFSFGSIEKLPLKYYGFLFILCVMTGVLGFYYDRFSKKTKTLYERVRFPNMSLKFTVPFLCAGILAIAAPELLGSGHFLIEFIKENPAIKTMIFVLIGRLVFSSVCFGSDAPGGSFLPNLAIGAAAGGLFAAAGMRFFGIEDIYLNNFILTAMAGFFSSSMNAPFTAFVLVSEMIGSAACIIPLAAASALSYGTVLFFNLVWRENKNK